MGVDGMFFDEKETVGWVPSSFSVCGDSVGEAEVQEKHGIWEAEKGKLILREEARQF